MADDSIDPASVEIVPDPAASPAAPAVPAPAAAASPAPATPAAAPAPAMDSIDPSSVEVLDPNEEPAWLKAAEWTLPAAGQIGGEAAGAALGAATGPAAPAAVPALAVAGGAVGNLTADAALDQMRRLAGVPRKQVDPMLSLGTGAAATGLSRFGAPILRGAIGAPSLGAVEDAGEAGMGKALEATDPITGEANPGPLKKSVSDVADELSGIGIRQSLGIPGDQAGSEIRNGLTQSSALNHTGAQDAALQPVRRLFEQKGKAIGDLLEPYKDVDADTTALADAAHMTPEGAFGGTIGDTVQKNGMKVSPAVQKMFQDASAMGDAGTDKVGSILGRLNTIQGMLGKPNLGTGDRYVLSELRDQYLDVAGDSQNIPQSVQNALKGPRAEYRTLKDYYRGFYGVGQTTSPAETGEFLWKQQPRALTTMLNEATPEETNHLANATGQYITNDGKFTGTETAKRFNEMKAQNPEAIKKLFGDGAWNDASTWSDKAKVEGKLLDQLKDPNFQGFYTQGANLAALNTPEAQGLASTVRRFQGLSKPEQARVAAELAFVSKPEGARNVIGGQRYFLLRGILFGGMGIGVFAHHPEGAVSLAALFGLHEGSAIAVREYPEMYLKMLRVAASGTPKGVYNAGYYGARMALGDAAGWLDRKVTDVHNAQTGPNPAAVPAPAAEATP